MEMKELKDHIKKCKDLYNGNKDWIEKTTFETPADKETLYQFINEYKRLKGRHSTDKCAENLKMFFKLTFIAFGHGSMEKFEGSKTFWETRQESFDCFVGYLGSLVEANRYFESVDNIKGYS
jgi:ribosomal protein S18